MKYFIFRKLQELFYAGLSLIVALPGIVAADTSAQAPFRIWLDHDGTNMITVLRPWRQGGTVSAFVFHFKTTY
jgi:hypothetical protein